MEEEAGAFRTMPVRNTARTRTPKARHQRAGSDRITHAPRYDRQNRRKATTEAHSTIQTATVTSTLVRPEPPSREPVTADVASMAAAVTSRAPTPRTARSGSNAHKAERAS
ncbi:hypothetical protein ACFV0H_02530 [Streptomyces erythrochromogenes]|uniref:hypothetical protein n=1 Tax=Streptomyces erythrochromogenes TaxID=285574 RepID=UPI003680C084